MWLGVRPIIRLASAPDGQGTAVLDVDCHDRRLVQDDAATAHVHEGVRRAEVDGHVAAEQEEPVVPHGVDLPLDGAGTVAESGGLPPLYLGVAPRLRDRTRPHKATATVVVDDNGVIQTSLSHRDLDAQVNAGKKMAISRAADSAESDPWTRFSVSSVPRSPRIVPGRRLGRVRRPHHGADDAPGVLGALHHEHHGGRAGDEPDQLARRRACPGALRSAREAVVLVDQTQLRRHQAQPLALEPTDQFAHETTLDGIGLADHKGAVHGSERLSGSAHSRRSQQDLPWRRPPRTANPSL